ncbi:MAG: hypothetical protein GY847_00915 [Proteobacteria bacterium]|nr:hypothetical protein [Pseudomonadota bacterium]
MTTTSQDNQQWQTLAVAHEFPMPYRRKPVRVMCKINEVDGRQFIDIRIHQHNEKAGGFLPTRRGITLPLECAGNLRLGITKILEASEAFQ